MPGFTHLGATLRLLRQIRGKSQAQIGRESQCGKGQISRYEAGVLPRLETLERILAALDVSPLGLCLALDIVDDIEAGRLNRNYLVRIPALPAFDAESTGLDHSYETVLRDLLHLYLGRREQKLAEEWALVRELAE